MGVVNAAMAALAYLCNSQPTKTGPDATAPDPVRMFPWQEVLLRHQPARPGLSDDADSVVLN